MFLLNARMRTKSHYDSFRSGITDFILSVLRISSLLFVTYVYLYVIFKRLNCAHVGYFSFNLIITDEKLNFKAKIFVIYCTFYSWYDEVQKCESERFDATPFRG